MTRMEYCNPTTSRPPRLQYRIVPAGSSTAAANVFADYVVEEADSWSLYLAREFVGHVWKPDARLVVCPDLAQLSAGRTETAGAVGSVDPEGTLTAGEPSPECAQ